jgi:23S rRNA (adenine2030-N6)-methyltransferase
MNYRHAYHAGNVADVFKHIVLVRIIDYLQRKEKAFRIIDTHAGAGRYDLSSPEAQKTGEWQGGIGRLLTTPLPGEAAGLLNGYLSLVREMNRDVVLRTYPGSPLIARKLLRRQDRLSAIEKHPQDAAALRALFSGDHQVKTMELDGWLALGAHVPPKERRGLVLVDPPFEEKDEFTRLAAFLSKAYRRWPGGIYALWYPVKDRTGIANFREALKQSGIARIVDCVLTIRPEAREERLDGSGMIIVNPPYTLEAELRIILPVLSVVLGEGNAGGWSLEWLTGERPVGGAQ